MTSNNGVNVHGLTNGPNGQGIDEGSHRKEKDNSLGEHEHGDEWVRDGVIDDNDTRPEA